MISNERTLRTRLRQDLRDDHDRLDGLMSGADLTSAAGLRRFYAAQLFGFRAIREGLSRTERMDTVPIISALLVSLERDLAELGQPSGEARTEEKSSALWNQLSGLAVDYVVLGSGLGASVLRKRWEMSGDAQVRGAGSFFEQPRHPNLWTSLVRDLAARPADGDEADRVTADAGRIFGFFEEGWLRSGNLKAP